MENFIISIIDRFGYTGIASLIGIENVFPPIPSEVILTFAGFATTISSITVLGAIIAATIGSVIGAIILYYIGRFLSEERLDRIVEGKLGKILGLKKSHINKAFTWFDNKGPFAVFFGRFIPIVRSMVSIPAGMAKMAMVPFLSLTTIGSLIWNTVLIYLGYMAGASWTKIAGYIGDYSDFVLGAFIVVLAIGIIRFYIKKTGMIKIIGFKKKKEEVQK